MEMKLVQYTPIEIAGTIPREPPPAVIKQTVTYEEFKKLKKAELKKQQERLENSTNIDGDWRCGRKNPITGKECGSSLWPAEVKFLIVDRKTRQPISTNRCEIIEGIYHCIKCEKSPPMFSSIGILEPTAEEVSAENRNEEDKIRGRIEKVELG